MNVYTFIQDEKKVNTARRLLRKLNRRGLCRRECDSLVQLQREVSSMERDILLGYANTLRNRKGRSKK